MIAQKSQIFNIKMNKLSINYIYLLGNYALWKSKVGILFVSFTIKTKSFCFNHFY